MKINPTSDYLNPDDRIADLETENKTLSGLFTKWHTRAAELRAENDNLLTALRDLHSFVAVMIGQGEDAYIPEHVQTPLGVPIKIGVMMRAAGAAIARAEAK